MDLDYFSQAIPITDTILNIVVASGWALLLGNLVFQASKSMMSGIGLEGEDPKTLFTRTFLFAFLLLASRQICEIGLGLTGTVIEMLQMPDAVSISLPDESIFEIAASWLLMIVVGVVLMWQIVKLFMTVGERYFLVGFLTIMAPWAFAMGGSKSTAEIFKGWVRMFASMCLMMVLNVVFLKMLLSALGNIPDDAGVIAWIIFVIAICRVARKIDSIIMRIGLNPSSAGDGLGRSILGNVASIVVMRTITGNVMKAISGMAGGATKVPTGGTPPQPQPGVITVPMGRNSTQNQQSSFGGTVQNTANTQTGTAGTADSQRPANTSKSTGAGSKFPVSTQSGGSYHGTRGTAGMVQLYQNQSPAQAANRRSSLPATPYGTHGMAGMDGQKSSESLTAQIGQRNGLQPVMPSANGTQKPIGTAGNKPGELRSGQSRYSAIPQIPKHNTGTPGTAGTAHSTRLHQGGVNNQVQGGATKVVNESASPALGVPKAGLGALPAGKMPTGTHGSLPTESRRSSADTSANPATPKQAAPTSNHGTSVQSTQPRQGRNAPLISPDVHGTSGHLRDSRNSALPTNSTGASAARQTPPARQEGGNGKPEAPRMSERPTSGTAGKRPEANAQPTVMKPGDISRNNLVNKGTRRLGANDSFARGTGLGETRKSQRNAEKDEGS